LRKFDSCRGHYPGGVELEGAAAKRLHEPYLCGERSWVKVKNSSYWRYELECEGAIRSRQSTSRTPV
jgi:ATP-dependent DNA ligase